MRQYFLSLAIFLGMIVGAQQKTFCNPINIDYGILRLKFFQNKGNIVPTADPVIVNFKINCFFFSTNRKDTGIVMICWTGSL